MKKKWAQMTFRRQMLVLYTTILMASLLICGFFYVSVIQSSARQRTEIQMEALEQEVCHQLDTASIRAGEYGKLISFSSEVQEYLKKGNGKNINKEKFDSAAISILAGNELVNSIYIYDLNGNYYAATDNLWRVSHDSRLEAATWYPEVEAAKGGDLILDDEDSFFGKMTKKGMVLIRMINDIETLETIGVLILNIAYEDIFGVQSDFLDQEDTAWFLLSREKGVRYGSQVLGDEDVIEISEENEVCLKLNGTAYSGYVCDYNEEFQIAVVGKNIGFVRLGVTQLYWLMLLFTLDIAVILVATRILERNVEHPVASVLDAMEQAGKGKLTKVEIQSSNLDMERLQRGYNGLIQSLEELFVDIKKEQRQKRKYELNVLNAQVRPHFLYNTFDSVCALALMERNDDVYQLMQALGKYYRISLHKGDEMITLEEELTIIKNYAIIQNYRFENVFEIQYDVDETLLKCKILKLILQPFVENAIYHGLSEVGHKGTILISAKREGQNMLLTIRDDGAGMSQEQIDNVLNGRVTEEEKSFGVYGTAERLSLHYGIAHPVSITAEVGIETTIEICIPIENPEQEKAADRNGG